MIQLNEIAPYLPYSTSYMRGKNIYVLTLDVLARADKERKFNEIKPLLLPLSYLTKEIEHNGERFNPKRELENRFEKVYFEIGFGGKIMIKGKNENYISHITITNIINQLLEWHFDINNLIGRGDAIDKTTLNQNQ